MPVIIPALGLGYRRRTLHFVLLSVFLSSTSVRAQDVAEGTRQRRAQKTEQKTAPHVYTDEDLKRDKILTPEDQARADARKKQTRPAGGPENAEALPANPAGKTESLGELARRYRKEEQEKEAHEAAEAARKKLGPFRYEVPDPTLASPNPRIAPLTKDVPEGPVAKEPTISPLLPPHVSGKGNAPRARISPFQPRPRTGSLSAPPILAVPPAAKPTPPIAYGSSRPVSRPEHLGTLNPAPAVDSSTMHGVQVQRGDSWWKLAEQYLGSGARWRELRSLNPAENQSAESLQAGTTIVVPELPRLVARPWTSIVVKKGDTLWGLAREYLGHSSSWGCLASANPQVSGVTRLTIGSTLRLPDSETLETCISSNPVSPTR